MLIARTLVLSVLLHTAVISLAATLSPYLSGARAPGDDVMLVELKGAERPAEAEETSGSRVKPPPGRVGKSESPGEIKKAVGKEKRDVRDIEGKDEVRETAVTDASERAEEAGEAPSAQPPPGPPSPSHGDEEVSYGVTPKGNVHAPESESLTGSSGGVDGPPGIRLTAVNSPFGGDEEDPIGQIREAIRKATLYPAFARQRRIEGTVVAGFFINSKGLPEDIRVLVSSGHGVLDREVVRIIKRAAPYPPLRAAIEVPISFRLLEGE